MQFEFFLQNVVQDFEFKHKGNATQIASIAHIQFTSLLSSSQQLAPAT